MYRMIPSIIAIPKEIKEAALSYYLKKCTGIYGLVFMQWRNNHGK
jgi:hypothetical protein